MDNGLSKEEWLERFRKIGRILLVVGILVCLVVFWPAIKGRIVNLFYKSMQSHIELTATTIKQWAKPEAAEVFQAELLECGFETVGDYSINLSKQVKIRAYQHPGQTLYATLYDRPGNPALLDFYTFYEDGSSVRMTTAPNPHRDIPPGKQIWYIEEPMSIRELLEKMLRDRPDKPVIPVSNKAFAPALKRYMEEISLWESKNFMQ